MIDVKVLRENPDLVRASQKARGEDVTLVDKALNADELRRNAIVEFEALRAEQNALSKSVGGAKGDEKNALLEKAKTLSASVKEAEAKKVLANADAYVVNVISNAISEGGASAVDFEIKKIQAGAIQDIAKGNNSKIILIPSDVLSSLSGSLTNIISKFK